MTFSVEVLAGALRREIRPRAEGQARLRAGYFDEWTGTASAFRFGRIDLVKWFPLWNSNQRIGFRQSLGWLETSGDGDIHFLRLLSNSGNDVFRGYQDYRWLDRGLLLTSAEYRWPLWASADADGPGVDAILLTDVGQVFREFEEVGGGRTTVSWGGGLEYVGKEGLIRFTAARSREEWEVRMGAVSDLDAVVRRLVSGRSPVPER
jgi:hypothetical protein